MRRAVSGDDGQGSCSDTPSASGAPPPPEGWAPSIPPDDGRLFKGGRVAPYGANLAVVLYRLRDVVGGTSSTGAAAPPPRHLVRLLHNEQVVAVPGCAPAGPSGLECDLEEFLQVVGARADAGALQRLCGAAAASNGGGGGGNGKGNGTAQERRPGGGPSAGVARAG